MEAMNMPKVAREIVYNFHRKTAVQGAVSPTEDYFSGGYDI
jgi:hypothetical protein